LLNVPPTNWANILLDFTSPSPLSWVPLPSAPTPNNSIYTVTVQNEAWGSALNTRLDYQATYDVLLFVFAIPLILWAEARLGGLSIEGKQLPFIISIDIYVWLLFALGSVVRLIFGYARWAFPKIEIYFGAVLCCRASGSFGGYPDRHSWKRLIGRGEIAVVKAP
jgi:hypothetical protein